MNVQIALMKEHIYKKRRPVEEFVRLLNESGYSINEILHDRFNYRFVDGATMFNHFLIKLAFIDSWKELVPEEKQQEFFAELLDRLNQLSQRIGYLNLTVPFAIISCEKVRE